MILKIKKRENVEKRKQRNDEVKKIIASDRVLGYSDEEISKKRLINKSTISVNNGYDVNENSLNDDDKKKLREVMTDSELGQELMQNWAYQTKTINKIINEELLRIENEKPKGLLRDLSIINEIKQSILKESVLLAINHYQLWNLGSHEENNEMNIVIQQVQEDAELMP